MKAASKSSASNISLRAADLNKRTNELIKFGVTAQKAVVKQEKKTKHK
jgi:hypothetical protein